jgi:hypothetical protein
VANTFVCPAIKRTFERFRRDVQTRYPRPIRSELPETLGNSAAPAIGALDEPVHIKKLPPEIGVLLLIVGVAGIMLPGPVGSPFVIAGGIALWPAGFRKAEAWMQKRAPGMYRTGIAQMDRFLTDLEHRYPGSVP